MEGKVLEEVKATVADSATNVNLNESMTKIKKQMTTGRFQRITVR